MLSSSRTFISPKCNYAQLQGLFILLRTDGKEVQGISSHPGRVHERWINFTFLLGIMLTVRIAAFWLVPMILSVKSLLVPSFPWKLELLYPELHLNISRFSLMRHCTFDWFSQKWYVIHKLSSPWCHSSRTCTLIFYWETSRQSVMLYHLPCWNQRLLPCNSLSAISVLLLFIPLIYNIKFSRSWSHGSSSSTMPELFKFDLFTCPLFATIGHISSLIVFMDGFCIRFHKLFAKSQTTVTNFWKLFLLLFMRWYMCIMLVHCLHKQQL